MKSSLHSRLGLLTLAVVAGCAPKASSKLSTKGPSNEVTPSPQAPSPETLNDGETTAQNLEEVPLINMDSSSGNSPATDINIEDILVPGAESPVQPTTKKSIRNLVQDYNAKHANAELAEGAAFYAVTGLATGAVVLADKVNDLSGRLARAMQAAGANIFVGATHDLRQKLYEVQKNREALAAALSEFKGNFSSGAGNKLGELNQELKAAQAAYDHSKSVMASRGALVVTPDFQIPGLEEQSARLAAARAAVDEFWKPENLARQLGGRSDRAQRVLSARQAIEKLTPMGEKLGQELAQATKSTAAELGRNVQRFIGRRISGVGHALEYNRGAIRVIGVGAAGLQLVYAGGLILQMSATEDEALVKVKEEINGATRELGSTTLPIPQVNRSAEPVDFGADILRQTGKTIYGGAGSAELPTP